MWWSVVGDRRQQQLLVSLRTKGRATSVGPHPRCLSMWHGQRLGEHRCQRPRALGWYWEGRHDYREDSLGVQQEESREGVAFWERSVAEPPNLMPSRSTCLPLDTKYLRDDTKLRSSVEHTPRKNPKIHIFRRDHKWENKAYIILNHFLHHF